jgi:hypothetical protein
MDILCNRYGPKRRAVASERTACPSFTSFEAPDTIEVKCMSCRQTHAYRHNERVIIAPVCAIVVGLFNYFRFLSNSSSGPSAPVDRSLASFSLGGQTQEAKTASRVELKNHAMTSLMENSTPYRIPSVNRRMQRTGNSPLAISRG